MGKMVAFLLAAVIVTALWVGASAFLALGAAALWNFIAVETRHPNAQISFWVAWAGLVLLAIIAQPFRVTVTAKSSD